MEDKVDPVIGVLTKGLGLIELIVVKRSLGGRTTINQAKGDIGHNDDTKRHQTVILTTVFEPHTP
jgi:hypothetical protein